MSSGYDFRVNRRYSGACRGAVTAVFNGNQAVRWMYGILRIAASMKDCWSTSGSGGARFYRPRRSKRGSRLDGWPICGRTGSDQLQDFLSVHEW